MQKFRKPLDCGCTVSTVGQLVRLPDHLCQRFLTGLAEAQLNSILSRAKHRRFAASSVIVHQGDPAERVFLLTSGHGRHFVITPKGKKISLHWLTSGQLFGGAALLVNHIPYLASTELLSNGCALMWDRKTIRDLVRDCPELLDNALAIAVTEHLAWILASHVSLTSDNATGRVAQFLLSLASGVGVVNRHGIELQIKNEDLAAGASVTPFTASRVLGRWQRAGVLTKGRGKLLLQKPELLSVTR